LSRKILGLLERKDVVPETNLAHRGDGGGVDPASEVTLNDVIIFSEAHLQVCIHFMHEYDCGACFGASPLDEGLFNSGR
jgi:hypothetical protein